jgi:hypothetical protein
MKRILIASILSIAFLNKSEAQVSIGIEAGATYNTLSQKVKGEERETIDRVGYRAGFNFNIPFAYESRFHLQPGIIFDGNSGSTSTYSRQSATGSGMPIYESDERNFKINQVNVPIYLVFKSGDPIYDMNHFTIGVGPSFSYTVGGRYHQVYSNSLNGSDRVQDEDIPVRIGTGTYRDYRPFNIGASIMLGYEFTNGLYLKGHYTYNVNNMNPLNDNLNQMFAQQGGITLGFFFHKFQKYKY